MGQDEISYKQETINDIISNERDGNVESEEFSDEYYYCTKKVRFLKKDILQYIYDYFETNKVSTAPFNDVYIYLQKVLKVTSVNRQHLRQFLKVYTDEITRNKIISMLQDYDYDECTLTATTITPSICRDLASVIEVLGLEFVTSYLQSDGIAVHSFLKALCPDTYRYRKLKLDIDLYDYICSFSEAEIIHLMRKDADNFCAQFFEFVKKRQIDKQLTRYISEIRQSIKLIPTDNLRFNLISLLKPNVATMFFDQNLITVADLISISDEQIIYFYNKNKEVFKALILALQRNLIQEFRKYFLYVVKFCTKTNKPSKDWEKYCSMMYARLHGDTLAAIGERYNCTRERIRQIEAKCIRLFRNFFYLRDGGRINLLRSFSEHKSYMTCEEVQTLVGEYYELFLFLLDEAEGEEILFANELNVILFENGIARYQEIQEYVANLPDTFHDVDLSKFSDEIAMQNEKQDIDFSKDIITKLLLQDYTLTGKVYSRIRMPLSKRYDMILRKFFPNGIHIYDDESLQEFNQAYAQTFGEDLLSKSKHALASRVAAVSILCDKGTYIAKYSPLISEILLKDICDYIDESEKEIFLTNTLFYCFEDRLKAEGIKNKYHLQGVLHECVGNKYYFSRDYVSKSKETSSLYNMVLSYIIEAEKPVSKEEIQAEFPALPEIILYTVCKDKDIICCFGKYLHINYFNQYEKEMQQLKSVIQKIVSDSAIHPCDDILHGLTLMYPKLIHTFYVDSKYTLYSIIYALWGDEFSMSRPFIAKKGIEIGRPSERLRAFLGEQDTTDVADFVDFARDNSLYMQNILKQINELNDEYFLQDKDTIIKIKLIGLTKYSAEYVDDFLEDILDGEDFIVGGQIRNFTLLPKINISWNAWLLYSVVNRWSKKYKVITTDSQFRFASPVFLRKEIPAENLEELLAFISKKYEFNEIQLMAFAKGKGLIK